MTDILSEDQLQDAMRRVQTAREVFIDHVEKEGLGLDLSMAAIISLVAQGIMMATSHTTNVTEQDEAIAFVVNAIKTNLSENGLRD